MKLDSREAVLKYVKENPGCQFKHIVDGIDFSRGAISKRVNRLLIDGELRDTPEYGHKKYFVEEDIEIELDM